jgi:hypothetical protein
MEGIGKQWSGNRWIAVAVTLWGLSLVSTFFALLIVWLDFGSDDFHATDFEAVLSQRHGRWLAHCLFQCCQQRHPYGRWSSSLGTGSGSLPRFLSSCWPRQCSGSAVRGAFRQLTMQTVTHRFTDKPLPEGTFTDVRPRVTRRKAPDAKHVIPQVFNYLPVSAD